MTKRLIVTTVVVPSQKCNRDWIEKLIINSNKCNLKKWGLNLGDKK